MKKEDMKVLVFLLGFIFSVVFLSLEFHTLLSGFVAGVLVVVLGFVLYIFNVEEHNGAR